MKKDHAFSKNTIGVICIILSEVINGITYYFIKTGVEVSNIFSLLSWRFTLAFLFLLLLVKLGFLKVDFKGKDLRPLIAIAFFSPVLFFLAETTGVKMTSTSESSVVLATIPVASLIASSIVLKERPTKNQVRGIVITLVGVVVTVIAAGLKISFSPLGYLILAVAVFSYACYSVLVARASNFTGPEVTFFMLLCGMIVFDIAALINMGSKGQLHELFMLPFVNRTFLRSVLVLAIIGSVLNFIMAVTAIDYIGVNRSVSFTGVNTLISIVIGITLLDEPFNKFQIIGSALILIGVYTANLQSPPISPAKERKEKA